jgi:hypothetical protein
MRGGRSDESDALAIDCPSSRSQDLFEMSLSCSSKVAKRKGFR